MFFTLYQIVHDIFRYGSSLCLVLAFCSSRQKTSKNEQIKQLSDFNWWIPQDQVCLLLTSHACRYKISTFTLCEQNKDTHPFCNCQTVIKNIAPVISKMSWKENFWHMAGAIIILFVTRYLLSENTLYNCRYQLIHYASFNDENQAKVWCRSLLVDLGGTISASYLNINMFKHLMLLSSHSINWFEIRFDCNPLLILYETCGSLLGTLWSDRYFLLPLK